MHFFFGSVRKMDAENGNTDPNTPKNKILRKTLCSLELALLHFLKNKSSYPRCALIHLLENMMF